MTTALVCIDFINEIVDSTGKLASKGYYAFTQKHGTLENLARRQAEVRGAGGQVIHVHLGFAANYTDHPASSLLLGGARAGKILLLGTPSTAIHTSVAPQGGDIIMVKKRISAFYGTSLELTLRSLGTSELIIAGVSTDLAVQSAARDAHDRDFVVKIASDACAAATDQDHDVALQNLAKFTKVI